MSVGGLLLILSQEMLLIFKGWLLTFPEGLFE